MAGAIGMTVRTRSDIQKVLRRVRRANIRTLGHAGAALRLTARRSIRRRKGPSAPGTPPHTHTGALRGSIIYQVEKQADRVVIGPTFGGVGTSGSLHEFGGRRRARRRGKVARYKKRPFMGPALAKIKPRLPQMWAGSVR